MQAVFGQCQQHLLIHEQKLQEMIPLVQQNQKYVHQLYEHMQGVAQNLNLLQAKVLSFTQKSVEHGNSAQFLESRISFRRLHDAMQNDIFKLKEICTSVSETFVHKKEYL
jgi:hypothetical protein